MPFSLNISKRNHKLKANDDEGEEGEEDEGEYH